MSESEREREYFIYFITSSKASTFSGVEVASVAGSASPASPAMFRLYWASRLALLLFATFPRLGLGLGLAWLGPRVYRRKRNCKTKVASVIIYDLCFNAARS